MKILKKIFHIATEAAWYLYALGHVIIIFMQVAVASIALALNKNKGEAR